MKNKLFTTKNIARMAILGTVAFVLMLLQFPLPFVAPAYYQFDFSEVAVLIGGFAMGPMAACVIEGVKIVLNLLFNGTSTMFVGELANFLIGCALVLPASIYYRNHKDRKHALISLVIGTCTMVVMGILMNYFLLLPAYGYFFKMDINDIVAAGHAIIPLINSKLTFVLLSVGPFNLIKGVLVSVVTALLYKHVSPLLHN